ncbi:hypothetical protein GE061_016454 [Apolygus lucorum]|uniref:Reverse transcriptase domain-containing protein n=1 Tax=Apolygus lucorum TaxID=248454 RepID=A0A8S9XKA1_APOLU|nr:hypothetical protein GE061_016454 [Apolygus lucorum]
MLPICESEAQVARIGIKIDSAEHLIGAFYSAPDRENHRLLMSTIWVVVHEMKQKFLMGGDYNAKHARWASATTNPRGRLLHDAVHQLNLEVYHPLEPTHYPVNPRHSPDILDIFLGKSMNHMNPNVRVIHALSSDHYPVLMNLNGTIPCRNRNNLIRHPFNWKIYGHVLANLTDLSMPLKTPQDIDKAVSKLTHNIHYAVNEASSPHNIITHRTTPHTPPHISQLLTIKHNARNLWERTQYPPHKSAYNRATLDLKSALTELKAEEKRNSVLLLNAKDGSLYRKAKLLTKQPNSIPPLKHENRWYSTAEEKARLFSCQIQKQFTPHPSHLPEFHNHVEEVVAEPLELSVFDEFFTPNQVKNAIKRSSCKKSPGSDRITQPLLKNFPRKTLVQLTQIYNAVLRTTYFPNRWKHAEIVMIPKPQKSANDPTGYRPISLLSIFSKTFERLMLPKLSPLLTPTIPRFQFGFRHLHSCQQQLHRVVEEILESFENQEVCQALCLDTKQAFDRVWHPGLLYKLKPLLPDTYFRLIQSFISNRTFHVKCDEAQSPNCSINASVPQGSVWGPILYLIYVCDIPTSQSTTAAMFADDYAVLSRDSTGTATSSNLQLLLNEIHRWSEQWRVVMNADKSSTTIFTLKTIYQTTPLTLNNQVIPQKTLSAIWESTSNRD